MPARSRTDLVESGVVDNCLTYICLADIVLADIGLADIGLVDSGLAGAACTMRRSRRARQRGRRAATCRAPIERDARWLSGIAEWVRVQDLVKDSSSVVS